jgi:hypothetical protein
LNKEGCIGKTGADYIFVSAAYKIQPFFVAVTQANKACQQLPG